MKKPNGYDNVTKELEGLEEGLRAETHIDLRKTILKKYHAIMEYMDSSSRNSQPFTSTRNEQMTTRSTRTRMDDQKKRPHGSRRTHSKDRPKQLRTHKVPTDDVENINNSNKGRDLALAKKPQIVP